MKTYILLVTLAVCVSFAASDKAVTEHPPNWRYGLIAESVGSVFKGLEGVVNTFVLDPTFRDHLFVIQQDFCSSFMTGLHCYRSTTVDLKLTQKTVHTVRNVAEALVDVLDNDAVKAENDGGPILDIANQIVRVFVKRPDLAKDATEAFITFYKASNAGCDCFTASMLEKRGDFFFVLRPFIESIRQLMAMPLTIFTGYLA